MYCHNLFKDQEFLFIFATGHLGPDTYNKISEGQILLVFLCLAVHVTALRGRLAFDSRPDLARGVPFEKP